MQTYNKEGHDALTKDLMGVAQSMGGKFYKSFLAYKNTYEMVEGHKTEADTSREMTNDIFVAVLSTEEGQQAWINYLQKKYDERVASGKMKAISNFFKRLKDSVMSIMAPEHTSFSKFQENMLKEKREELIKRIDPIIDAFDKALDTYHNGGKIAASNVNTHNSLVHLMNKKMGEIPVVFAKPYDQLEEQNKILYTQGKHGDVQSAMDLCNAVITENMIDKIKEKNADFIIPISKFKEKDYNVIGKTLAQYIAVKTGAKYAEPFKEVEGDRFSNKKIKERVVTDKLFAVYNEEDYNKVKNNAVIVTDDNVSSGSTVAGLIAELNKLGCEVKAVVSLAVGTGHLPSIAKEISTETKSSGFAERKLGELYDKNGNAGREKDYGRTGKEVSGRLQKGMGQPGTEKSKERTRKSIRVDSEGNDLSIEQQIFFSESKILDKNGALKVMYHGTNNYGFNVFDIKKAKYAAAYGKGFYFSDSDSHAGQYGQRYKVYLNIVNPVTTDTNNITKDQMLNLINEIANDEDYGIDNYGYDATPQSVLDEVWGKDDFAMLQDINAGCVGDFAGLVKMFNRINGTSYDGIVAPTETIAFYSNQIKLTDNYNPTKSDDIRYSAKVNEEEFEDLEAKSKGTDNVDFGKTLIAVHNMSLEQLDADIDLDGLPSPSIAIIRSGMEHSKYGNVSLMFKRDTIDPKVSRNNKVYGGDAWTPTFPRVEVKIDSKAASNIRKKINELIPESIMHSLSHIGLDEDNMTDKINRRNGSAVEAYKDSDGLKYAFLKEQGIELEPETKEARLNSRYTNEQILAVANLFNAETAKEARMNGYETYKNNPELVEKMRVALNDQFREKYGKSNLKLAEKDLYEELSFSDFDNITSGVNKYYRDGIVKEADNSSLRQETIRKMINQKQVK